MKRFTCALTAGALAIIPSLTLAGDADVVGVRISQRGDSYHFSVTVRHADAGWEHYANNWEIVMPDGTVLGTRVLAHPHDNEQPFTRSLGSVRIPDGVTKVRVRAHDKVHGHGGREMEVDIKTGEAHPIGGQS